MSDNRGANLSRLVLKQAGRAKEKVLISCPPVQKKY
jgi:hypothetical protein